MARFIAGDELGGLKAVSFSRSDEKITVNSLRAGGEDKTRAVQRLTPGVPSSSSPESVLFASAHADGSAAAYTLNSEGELESVKEWTEPRLKTGQKYVGLALAESGVYSCTSNGALRLTKLPSSSETALEQTSSYTAVLPMRLADWHLSSSSRIFAYAGDEVELSLWDTERAFAAREKPVQDAEPGKKKRKRGEELLPGESWRARNVPNDTLSLRQPVRNTTLTFLNGRDDSLAVGTAFGDVRRYDTRAQKRPVANWTGIGKVGGIAAIESGEHELYVSDNGTSVFALDVRTGTILGGYAGIAGAVHAIATGPKGLVASAARDRYVRVHSTPGFNDQDEESGGKGGKGDGKGKVLDKAYLKSVPSALVWDGLHVETAQVEEGDEESDEEDVWDGMAVVDEDDDDDDEEAEGKKTKRKRAKGGSA